MLFNQGVYLIVAEVNLISHIQEGALPQLEVVHSLGPLSCQDDYSEAVGEGPWYPISGLLRIDSLIILVVSEVLKAIQDHDDPSLAVTPTGTVSLTVLLRLI